MSKRGRALGGNYTGIYERKLKNGRIRYAVLIKFQQHGKTKTKMETVDTLKEALQLRKEVEARRILGDLDANRPSVSESQPLPLLEYVAEQYLASKEAKRTYQDIKRLIFGPDGIVAFFGRSFDLSSIRDTDIVRYKKYLNDRPKQAPFQRVGKANRSRYSPQSKANQKKLANRTKDCYLTYLRAILRKAQAMRLIDYIPEFEMFGKHNRRELRITLKQFVTIVDQLPQPPRPHRAMLLMELFTAQRWGDLSTMKRRHIEGPIEQGAVIECRSSKTMDGNMIILMPQPLSEELQRLEPYWAMGEDAYLFPNPLTGKPYTSIRQALDTACKKCQITPFEFYQFRHLAATEYLRILRDPNLVAKILGHQDSSMVDRIYGHVLDRAAPGVIELGDRLSELKNSQGVPMVDPPENDNPDSSDKVT